MKKDTVFLLALIPFSCFFIAYLGFAFFIQSRQQPTPTVEGCLVQDAVKILSEKHLSLRVIRQKSDAAFVPGFIISQVPRPGALIKPNQHVFVTIASAPEARKAPSFINMRQDAIVAQCDALGLRTTFVLVHSHSARAGICIAQSPEPGASLLKNEITLFISQGKNSLAVMPQLIGVSYQQLQKILHGVETRVEFDLPEGSIEPSDEMLVVAQQPQPGTIITLRGGQTLQFMLKLP